METVFRASRRALSLWHVKRIASGGDELRDLCFGRFEGFGEALLTAETCRTAKSCSDVFEPRVCWRPDTVEPDWQRWRDAHVHIEADRGNANFPRTYCISLAVACTVAREPDVHQ